MLRSQTSFISWRAYRQDQIMERTAGFYTPHCLKHCDGEVLNPRKPPHYFLAKALGRVRGSRAKPEGPGRASIAAACLDEPQPFQVHCALSPNWIGRNGLLYRDVHVRARPGLQ